jgi:hypothetical protein
MARVLRLPVEVGVWDTCYTANVYTDKVVVLSPCLKSANYVDTLYFHKEVVTDKPLEFRYISKDKIISFWNWLGVKLNDSYLTYYGY